MDDVTSDTPTLQSPLPTVAGLVAGRYQVRSRLGRGATKEVYLAYDERLDREVALAIVVGAADEIARARVAREAQVTGRLGDHPNIITIYDTGELEGVPYLVMRAMSGGSLADLLARERPPLQHTIRLCREIALALAHAHEHGVVHRDVKPDNVWLAADGSAALGDFGIAHRAGSDRLTAEGMVLGTVRYLSPEQIRGAEIGPASDLYALGVTLYELVTGRAPFVGDDPMHVLTQHLTAQPVAPSEHEPGVPDALERLILALLAKAPQKRPASAGEVASALGAIAGSDEATVAAAVGAQATAHGTQARRFVSVLAASADIDPEALHAALDRCAAAVERHGGTVQRYLGDVAVGFFGLTESHGDDALRAARAALELTIEAPALRLGIESGELFLGPGPGGGNVATGAAIKAAVRLAEDAGDGEILLGDRQRRAVGADASIDSETGRLLGLQNELPGLLRAADTPFVGRRRELDELRTAFELVRGESACRLVTLAGPPGIGKSRLARQFLGEVHDDAKVLVGRCLAYGEGTTYRAVVDIVRGLGPDPRAELERLLPGDDQAQRAVLGAVGLSDEPAQAEETSWAMRRLLAQLARERPLVVAVEDIHWAEPALLELLDHLVVLSSGAPILLLCLTRPELLEARPEWVAPQPDRSVIVLDALAQTQARELAARLGAGEHADRIAERAEGNPLFVEQLVAVDADDGELPESIQAVLAARIDHLDPGERTVLQRASVEGRTFHAGALAVQLPAHEQRAVGARLVSLSRKGLIAADRPVYAGEDAFRFGHALIREAAYGGVPKLQRADLHAGLAQWLGDRPAADEIVGFHLEQACCLRRELGYADETERSLAAGAIARLEAASRAALVRGDTQAASTLLERAVAVAGSDAAARGALLPALGASLFEAGRITEAVSVLDEAIAGASAQRLAARAQIEREFVRLETDTDAQLQHSLEVADRVLPLLERDGDDHGQCRAWSLRAQVAWIAGRLAEADAAWCEAAGCARRAGDDRELLVILRWRATAAMLGPTPVSEAIRLCEGFGEMAAGSPVATAWIDNALAVLHAMSGDFERAERFVEEANATLDELGGLSSSVSHHEALVRLLADQPELAEVPLRAGVQRLTRIGDNGLLATTTAMLAQAVYAQGRLREADELCEATSATAAADDIITQVIWRGVRAKILARDGRCDDAEAVARGAVEQVQTSDMLSHEGDAMLDLADVLRACGRPDEARRAVEAALELFERKGNVVAIARAAEQLHR